MRLARSLCPQFCPGATSFRKSLSSRKGWRTTMRWFFPSLCKTVSFFEKFFFTRQRVQGFEASGSLSCGADYRNGEGQEAQESQTSNCQGKSCLRHQWWPKLILVQTHSVLARVVGDLWGHMPYAVNGVSVSTILRQRRLNAFGKGGSLSRNCFGFSKSYSKALQWPWAFF